MFADQIVTLTRVPKKRELRTWCLLSAPLSIVRPQLTRGSETRVVNGTLVRINFDSNAGSLSLKFGYGIRTHARSRALTNKLSLNAVSGGRLGGGVADDPVRQRAIVIYPRLSITVIHT